ncbi:MAG: hypothetical protein FJ264_14175 [Planctomycetes bacterium]|nr:hypothetical protein [Planctomycetota bacterium]
MPQITKIPPHFSIVKNKNTTLYVKKEYKEFISDIIAHTHPSKTDNSGSFMVKQGRGRYLSVPIKKNGEERLIIRNYKHGGLLGKIFGNVFLNGNRPFNEINIHEVALQNGVPSAEAIAIAKRKILGGFYSADFITKEISGAVDLMHFLAEHPAEYIRESKKSVILVIAGLIRKMHDVGIYHADLHLKNILVKKNPDGAFEAYIIDLDKSTVLPQLTLSKRMKNLLRLDRSLEKYYWLQRKKTGKELFPISKTDRMRFFKAYMANGTEMGRNWKAHIRQYYSSHTFHKFWWRVLRLS